MHGRLRSRAGFSLIESLAAFAILALVLSQLLSGVSGGVRNESRADFLLRASRQGASHLDSLGVESPAPFGETTGRYSDGLYWTLTVVPGKSVSGPTGAPIATSYHARLVVKRPSGYGETFVLSTVKVVAIEPQQQQQP
jgi:prepilin-type N-terminal cleavage/methylation domain-containing protein